MNPDEKTYWLRKVKALATSEWGYRNGEELIKLMDYYHVSCLSVLTADQVKAYYEEKTR